MAIDQKPDQATLEHWAEQLGQEFLPEGWAHVVSSGNTRVAYHAGLQLYYKEFLPRSPLESAKAMLRGSRACRARDNADALRAVGIRAPDNVHWGKLQNGREYLFMAEAPGQGVDDWLRQTLPDDPDSRALRRQLLRELGVFVGRVHAFGFVHGDLRPGNILAHRVEERFQFTLIDNERLHRGRPAAGRRLLRNLMQLNMLPLATVSRSDRMRFFCQWRRQMRDMAPLEAKILAAEAYLWAMRRQAG